MRTLAELFRPTGVGGWLLYILAAVFVALVASFGLTGQTQLGRLQSNGIDTTVEISRVLDRAADGTPTKVEIGSNYDGKTHVLDDLAGSVQGQTVRVRAYNADAVMMSQTAYASATVLKELGPTLVWPIAVALLVVGGLNARHVFRKKTPSYWATPATGPGST